MVIKVLLPFYLALAVVIAGEKALNRKAAMEQGIFLPRGLRRVGNYCTDPNRMEKFISRIKNPQEAKKSAFVCAFVAFQKSKIKGTEPYTKDTVEQRFENFMKCIKDIHQTNQKQSSWKAGITSFCDMTDEEKKEHVGELAEVKGGMPTEGDDTMEQGQETILTSMNLKPVDLKSDNGDESSREKGMDIEEETSTPPTYYESDELLAMGIHLPEDLEGIEAYCVDGKSIRALSQRAYVQDDVKAYACAFVSLQHLKQVPLMADEVDSLFTEFRGCVAEVEGTIEKEAQGVMTLQCDVLDRPLPFAPVFAAPPSSYKAEELLQQGIHVPASVASVKASCLNGKNVQVLAEQAYLDGSDEAFLCAFVAFQRFNDKRTPEYSDDNVDARLETFRKCVLDVGDINSDKTKTWTAEVNFFCDMFEEEYQPYSNGILLGGEFEMPKVRN